MDMIVLESRIVENNVKEFKPLSKSIKYVSSILVLIKLLMIYLSLLKNQIHEGISRNKFRSPKILRNFTLLNKTRQISIILPLRI